MHLRSMASSTRIRRSLLLAAATVFFGGAAIAVNRLEIELSSVRWGYLAVLVATGVPLTIAGKAAEYYLSARLIAHRATVRDSLTISIMSTAANLLPIPGSVLVRVEALHRLGSPRRTAVASADQ